MGDLAGAQLSSSEARKWSKAGLLVGLVMFSLTVLVNVALVVFSLSTDNPYGN